MVPNMIRPIGRFVHSSVYAITVTGLLSVGVVQYCENHERDRLMVPLQKYADKNSDGILSYGEQGELWKRMGFGDSVFVESDGIGSFPTPSLAQVKKALRSYSEDP